MVLIEDWSLFSSFSVSFFNIWPYAEFVMGYPMPVVNIELLLCTEIFLPGSCISANGLVQKEYVTLNGISEPWSYVTRLHM